MQTTLGPEAEWPWHGEDVWAAMASHVQAVSSKEQKLVVNGGSR